MDNYINVNMTSYDRIAAQYATRNQSQSQYEINKHAYWEDYIAKHVDKYTNSALEIGPGAGEMLKRLNSLGFDTIAVELSQNMAEVARKNAPNSLVFVDNILNIEFAERQFDLVFAAAVIHNFTVYDAKKLLSKISTWLHPNGFLILDTTKEFSSEEGFFEKKDYSGNISRYRKKYTEDEFKNLLTGSNYKIVHQYYNSEPDREKTWMALVCTL